MIALGALSFLVAVVGLWMTRKGTLSVPKWAWNIAIWSAPIPVLGISMGWLFTEMGRQPWIVFKLMKTADAVSPGINGVDVLISLIVFTTIYGILAVVEIKLLLAAAQKGIDESDISDSKPEDADKLAVAY
jgi:cytochrome d ubiquinol oxidase subunit I